MKHFIAISKKMDKASSNRNIVSSAKFCSQGAYNHEIRSEWKKITEMNNKLLNFETGVWISLQQKMKNIHMKKQGR